MSKLDETLVNTINEAICDVVVPAKFDGREVAELLRLVAAWALWQADQNIREDYWGRLVDDTQIQMWAEKLGFAKLRQELDQSFDTLRDEFGCTDDFVEWLNNPQTPPPGTGQVLVEAGFVQGVAAARGVDLWTLYREVTE